MQKILTSLGYKSKVYLRPHSYELSILGDQSEIKRFVNDVSPVTKLPKGELKSKEELQFWRGQEVEILSKNFGEIAAWKIAEKLDRSPSAIYQKAEDLGLESNLMEKTQFGSD